MSGRPGIGPFASPSAFRYQAAIQSAGLVQRLGRGVPGAMVILLCFGAGSLLQRVLTVPIPAGVLGMFLLLLLLATGVLPEGLVSGPAMRLLTLLPAVFVALYTAALADPAFLTRYGYSLVPAAILGSVLTLVMTALVARWMVRS